MLAQMITQNQLLPNRGKKQQNKHTDCAHTDTDTDKIYLFKINGN